jgi:hypothetical protein
LLGPVGAPPDPPDVLLPYPKLPIWALANDALPARAARVEHVATMVLNRRFCRIVSSFLVARIRLPVRMRSLVWTKIRADLEAALSCVATVALILRFRGSGAAGLRSAHWVDAS